MVSFTMKVYVLVFVHKPKTTEKRKKWLQHILKHNYCARKTQNTWHNSWCLGKENKYYKCLCIKLLLRENGGGRHWMYISISLDTCYKTAEKVQILIHAESFMGRNMHYEYSSPSPSHRARPLEDPAWGSQSERCSAKGKKIAAKHCAEIGKDST